MSKSPEWFWENTRDDGECVVWSGPLRRDGRPTIYWEGKKEYAYRVAFFLRLGRWPETDLRHLCNRPACVLHVVEGTRTENQLDIVRAGNHNHASKTHCKRNHPFDAENTKYVRRAGKWFRSCRQCRRDREREARATHAPAPE